MDIQGFQLDNRRFVAKEIAILTRNGLKLQHWLIQPPCPWQDLTNIALRKRACWLERNYHGLGWSDGHIPYYTTQNIISKMFSSSECKIYVKGNEKKRYMEAVLGGTTYNQKCIIVDLSEDEDEYAIPPPSLNITNEYTSKYSCLHHRPLVRTNNLENKNKIEPSCALKNAFTLQTWLSR